MVGPLDPHDPIDPINDPLAAPPPETLDYGELDAVVSSPTEYADPDKMEYQKRASIEKKYREGIEIQRRKEADRRFEEQQSNTNESELSFGECSLSDCDNKTLSEFCPSCESTLCQSVAATELDF